MRSIQARFQQQEKATPNAGAYINLQRAVRGQRFLHRAIRQAFWQIMPADDYDKKEQAALIDWLDILSNRRIQS